MCYLNYNDIVNHITIFKFVIKADKGKHKIFFSIPWLDKPHMEISYEKFHNEIIYNLPVFYKKEGYYLVYVPLQNFWNANNTIDLDTLLKHFGSIDEICPKFRWELFWMQSETDKEYNEQIDDWEYKKEYYLANGDDEFWFDPENDEYLEKLCKEGKVTKVATRKNEYIEAQPKWFMDEDYTSYDILTYHIETCGAKEIWVPKLHKK